jgi:hypothetical protein
LASLHDGPGDAFRRLHELVQADVSEGVVPSRSQAASNHWILWQNFCDDFNLDSTLVSYDDPVPILQVFAYLFRNGVINASGRKVRARSVEDATRSIGQAFAAVGARDPRLNSFGKMDFRLNRMWKAYKKQDPPPNRVKPIPVPILQHILAVALLAASVAAIAVADMICLAFFFLLRPGEYTGTKSTSTPFRLCDVELRTGAIRHNVLTTPIPTLLAATFVTLTFTTQKNGVRGEVMGLARSGSPTFCPVQCVIRRVVHLRQHGAPATTPLASYYDSNNKLCHVSSHAISTALKLAVQVMGAPYGFLPTNISARSLRAAGAMALLCAQVDSDIIRLLGRWRSDEMLRYLHVQAEPVMRNFSTQMLQHGTFTLLPNQDVPMF